MIAVQKPISPKVTEIENQISRVRMRGNASAKKIKELRAKKLAGQHNINDKDSRIALVLAGEEFPATRDIDAQITTEMLNWEATSEAEQSLKQPLDAARREASDKILVGIKPGHDVVMKKLASSLSIFTESWIELFQLSRDLRDYEIGYRNGVCEVMPLDLVGPPTIYSPLADFLRELVKAGHLKALPEGFIK